MSPDAAFRRRCAEKITLLSPPAAEKIGLYNIPPMGGSPYALIPSFPYALIPLFPYSRIPFTTYPPWEVALIPLSPLQHTPHGR